MILDMKKIIMVNQHHVYGLLINENTGCLHHDSSLDVIAIKFKCCMRYYACYSCHLALADHPAERWHSDEFHRNAILCGQCRTEMTIQQYILCKNECLNCKSQFNSKCELHWDKYFITELESS